MDKHALRALVVTLKEDGDSGSFQDISRILAEDYAVHKSRQELCRIYNSTIEKEKLENKKATAEYLLAVDIARLTLCGYNMRDITKLMMELGVDTNYDKLRDIRNRNKEIIEVSRDDLVDEISALILISSKKDIAKVLRYKGIEPNEKGIKNMMTLAYTKITREYIVSKLAKCYNDLGDKDVVRGVISNLGLDISIVEVKQKDKGME